MNEAHCDIISVSGEPLPAFWTKRALERTGFAVASQEMHGQRVNVKTENGQLTWECLYKGKASQHESLESLTDFLKKGGGQ